MPGGRNLANPFRKHLLTGDTLPVGSVIGILGGGQLGRMLCAAASRLGMLTHVFAPEPDPPATQVCSRVTRASYSDRAALQRFAGETDVVTFEFENIPADALRTISCISPTRPGTKALTLSQDRAVEKRFLAGLGLRVAPHMVVGSASDLDRAIKTIGLPLILKSRRFGYDGKGQATIRTREDAGPALELVGNSSIVERMIDFDCELSVIGARAIDGSTICFDPGENRHEDGILRSTLVPAQVRPSVRDDAVLIAGRILNALDYVGVIGVELFLASDGLVVNEIAPRVHNSGHWTQDGCVVDQFEQHVRAISGWPLADGRRHSDVAMTNLIGDDISQLFEHVADSNAGIHVYGKSEVRPGRKMGHVNRVLGPALQP